MQNSYIAKPWPRKPFEWSHSGAWLLSIHLEKCLSPRWISCTLARNWGDPSVHPGGFAKRQGPVQCILYRLHTSILYYRQIIYDYWYAKHYTYIYIYLLVYSFGYSCAFCSCEPEHIHSCLPKMNPHGGKHGHCIALLNLCWRLPSLAARSVVFGSGVQLRVKVVGWKQCFPAQLQLLHNANFFKGFAMIWLLEISLNSKVWYVFELPVAAFHDISCWVWLLHAPGCPGCG